MSRVIVQAWSAPQCQTGAVPLGPIAGWSSARVTETDGSVPQLVLRDVPAALVTDVGVRDGNVLKVLSVTRGVSWWVIRSVVESDGIGSGLTTITAGPLRFLLALRGLVRQDGVYAFTPPADMSLAWLTREYVLATDELSGARAEKTTDGLEWLELGTIEEPDAPITLPAFAKATYSEVLATLERLAQRTAVLRPLVPDGSTGFALDLLRDPTSALTTPVLSVGAGLAQLGRTRDLLRTPNVVVPFASSGRTLDVTAWSITAIDGAGPAWITLRDPDAIEDRYLVREDGQWVGAYLLQDDGTTHEILDSRASDGAVEVTSITGLAVDDVVGLCRDTSGRPVTEVVSLSGVAARDRVVATQEATAVPLARNRVRNARMQEWTDTSTPAHLSLIGGCGVVRYRRIELTSAWSALSDGAHSIGATVIALKSAIANSRLYGSEVLDFAAGSDRVIATAYTEFDGAGDGTVTLTAGLTAGIADNSVVSAKIVQSTAAGEPGRPFYTALSRDGDPEYALRFRTPASSATWPPPVGDDQVRSGAVLVRYDSDEPTRNRIRAAAGLSVANGGGNSTIGNIVSGSTITTDPVTIGVSGRRLPALLLVGDPAGTPARLAHSIFASSVVAGATVNETVSCEHTISTDTVVAVGVTPPRNNVSTYLPFSLLRWLSLWVGDEDTAPVIDGSPSNSALHAAQDALQAGLRYRLQGVDLHALLASGTPLALNQRVRLRSARLGVDTVVRIVRLDWSLSDDSTLDAEGGTVTPRLSAATVTL